jgi:hypothetical protein
MKEKTTIFAYHKEPFPDLLQSHVKSSFAPILSSTSIISFLSFLALMTAITIPFLVWG